MPRNRIASEHMTNVVYQYKENRTETHNLNRRKQAGRVQGRGCLQTSTRPHGSERWQSVYVIGNREYALSYFVIRNTRHNESSICVRDIFYRVSEQRIAVS